MTMQRLQGAWRRTRGVALGLGIGALVGCATTPVPIEQIKFFSQAFTAVNAVGQPLLDDLALAERAQGQRVAVARARRTPPGEPPCGSGTLPWAQTADPALGYISGYCLQDAGYYATIGDPPATAELRSGLRVIEQYAEILTTLAEGRNIEQGLGQVDALGAELGGLLQLVGAQAAISPALTALRPLLGNIAKQANAEEARRLILEGAPIVNQLIGALRDAVPPLFDTLVSQQRRNAMVAAGAAAAVKEIEARRLIASQYVVLLDRLQKAWDATVLAARHPGGSRLSDLVARSAELRADAEAVRRSLSALRSGAAPTP